MSLSAGDRLGSYEILEPLGAGGMGEVYRAHDEKLGRDVAVKVLPVEVAQNEVRLGRFRREAKMAAALDHPYICKIYELGDTDDGRAFIAMEYVEGETLQARLERGPLALNDGVRVGLEIAEALVKADERGIVHRDLKPANVMLSRDGHVKVMDFGLAKPARATEVATEAETLEELSGRGVIAGTPGYMSPEQLRGATIDGRSDLFAFGVVLQEILTCTHPFRGDSGPDTIAAILREAPVGGEELPSVVRQLVAELLSREPEKRPSHEQTRLQLEQWVAHPDLLAATAGPDRAFVGRETEFAELWSLAERLRTGKGSVALVGGEPGVGKTRLAREILSHAGRQGLLALEGHCDEMEGAQSYLPWIEGLELAIRLVPEPRLRDALGEAAAEIAKLVPEIRHRFHQTIQAIELPPELQQRYLFNSIGGFLDRLSASAPIVWLFDDLHWADDSTLLLLQHLLPRLEDLPILFIGTYRDVDLDVGKPFERVLSQLVRQRLGHRITLRRLSEGSTAELIQGLAGRTPPSPLVHMIYRETEGNPFFVEEVFQHLWEEQRLFDKDGNWIDGIAISELDVPEGVRLVIGRRLERLKEAAARVLRAAAVIGRVFDPRVLESIDSLDPEDVLDAIEEAEAARLITTTMGDQYSFTHELIRQTLMAQQSLPRRQRMHLQIAGALEKSLGARAEEKAIDIANHLVRAGAAADSMRTVRYLVRAGDNALAAAAPREASHFFEAALSRCHHLADGDLRVQALEQAVNVFQKRGLLRFTAGDFGGAIGDFDRMLADARRLGDRRLESTALAYRGWIEWWNHEFDKAELTAREALELAGEYMDDVRFFASSTLGLMFYGTHRTDEAEPHLRAAEQLAPTVDDPLTRSWWSVVGWHRSQWEGRFDDTLRHLERWRGSIEKTRSLFLILGDHWLEALTRASRGEYSKALALLEEVLATSERVGGVPFWATRALNTVGWIHGELEDPLGAMDWNRRGIAAAIEADFPDPEVENNARLNFADNLMALGRLDEAEEQLQRVEAVVRDPTPAQRLDLWRYSQHLFHTYGALWLVRGDTAKTLKLTERCLELAEPGRSPRYVSKARCLRAQVFLRSGKLAESEAELKIALENARLLGNPPQLWRTLVVLGDLQSAQDQTDPAREARLEALAVIEGVAADLEDASLADTLLRSSYVGAIRAATGAR
jgi:tetratricopeptide (TPR) repeat protein/predicted Ser/Thr protein kinase